MKKIYLIVCCLLLVLSCKKWKCAEVKIYGEVINGTLGIPMSGEQIQLIEVKDEFLGPGNGNVIKTVTTNSNGEYDFEGVDLRKKNKFKYYVSYVHRGITTLGFCDTYEVDKNAIDQNKDLVVYVKSSLYFQIVPNLSVLGPNDSINIKVKTSADFSNFYCNPNAVSDYADKTQQIYNKNSFFSDGKSNPLSGGDADYYIEIKKVKSGVTSITYDTVSLRSVGYTYNINW